MVVVVVRDGYTQAEVDALLNNKLNVNNPQDIIGNLRLDPTNGNSKIILNAVSPPNANDDFYCNGNGHFNGTLTSISINEVMVMLIVMELMVTHSMLIIQIPKYHLMMMLLNI